MKLLHSYPDRAKDSAPFEDRYRQSSIATLCDPNQRGITCSEYAVTTVLAPAKIVTCKSFEDAAAAVVHSEADALVVPCAYRNIAHLLHSSDLLLIDGFIAPLPPLVLAGISENRPQNISTLFYQAAVECMISELKIECIDETEPVASNAVACYAVKNAHGVTACITSKLAADRLGLITYQILRAAQRMAFLVFTRCVNPSTAIVSSREPFDSLIRAGAAV